MKRKKTKSYWVEDTPEKLDYINQTLYEENMKLNKELAKYKRAFEILKELLSLCKDVSLNGEVDFYTLYFTGELPYECYKRLTKEKYELLEELMKDD